MTPSETTPVRAAGPDPVTPRGLGALTSGAGTRTEIPVPQAPAIVIPDLPWAYEDDRVVLLVRDPRTLFSYWDFSTTTMLKAQEAVPEGRPWLRLLSLGGSEPRVVREFELDLKLGSLYLYELDPNRDYRIEIVLRNPAGAEQLLGRSVNAAVPSNKPSSWVEDRFASIPLEVPLPVAAVFTAGRVSVDAERRLHSRAYELSGGEVAPEYTGDVASSSQGIAQGFGGRSWSGTLVRK